MYSLLFGKSPIETFIFVVYKWNKTPDFFCLSFKDITSLSHFARQKDCASFCLNLEGVTFALWLAHNIWRVFTFVGRRFLAPVCWSIDLSEVLQKTTTDSSECIERKLTILVDCGGVVVVIHDFTLFACSGVLNRFGTTHPLNHQSSLVKGDESLSSTFTEQSTPFVTEVKTKTIISSKI